MAYVPTTFVDRSVEFPNRRKLTAVSGLADTFDVARAEGTVFAEGTKPDAANLNAEFGKIKAETDAINSSLTPVTLLDKWDLSILQGVIYDTGLNIPQMSVTYKSLEITMEYSNSVCSFTKIDLDHFHGGYVWADGMDYTIKYCTCWTIGTNSSTQNLQIRLDVYGWDGRKITGIKVVGIKR